MNDKFTDKNSNEDIVQKLNQVAEQTHVNSQFAAELEERLRNAHSPKASWFAFSFKRVSPTLRWVALMILLGLVLSLSIKSLIPLPQPSINPTSNNFVCPVTQPNGSLPPGTQTSDAANDPNLLGNDEIWTVLSPGGKTYLFPENQRTDGSFEINWPWYRGTDGQLTIEGRRLDEQSELLRSELSEGFNNFQGSTLIFPAAGCWEITGRVGNASLTFVTEVIFNAATPAPTLVVNGTATAVAKDSGYDFRGAKLYLEQPLPESQDQAHIYLLKKDEPATEEQARALADRFGIQGEMYSAPDYIFSTTDFLISDGKQMLQVYSERFFSYTSDMSKTSRGSVGKPNDNAEAIIHEFLQARGMDFPFSMSAIDSYGGYGVQPLAPDSIPMQYESFTQPVMRVTLDETGQVLSFDAYLMDYDQAPVGEYGIISAQEALQKVLDDSMPSGKMEFFNSPDNIPQEWYRSHPDNQPVTMYGYLSSRPSMDPNKPELVLINGVSLTGNINGLESMEDFSFVKAIGQYFVENGIRKFDVQSWDRKVTENSLSGTLSRQGDQIVFTSDDGSGTQYQLIDPPADVPLDTETPDSQLSVTGVITSGKMDWTYIQYFANYGGGGGGGGNGLGFYKLNLSGTPVPFPSSIPQQATTNQPTGIYTIKEGDTLLGIAQNFGTTVDELIRLNNLTDTNIIVIGQPINVPSVNVPDRKIENVRGFLTISIHQKSDGTESREYNLEASENTGSSFYQLNGPHLNEMDAYNGLPIIVSGTISGKTGLLSVENYNTPYPDLQFQIAKGRQRSEQLEGQTVVIFTTEDGKSYVEVIASTNQLANQFTGYQGDMIQQEILVIPDETFGGMPVAHIYQSSIIVENGPEMQVRANQIHVYPEGNDPSAAPDYAPPNLNIDRVELVYYVSNPYYQINDPNYSQRSPYIQPVWHFHGRYEDGTEFDVLIQALKQEFLLPELAPGLSPG